MVGRKDIEKIPIRYIGNFNTAIDGIQNIAIECNILKYRSALSTIGTLPKMYSPRLERGQGKYNIPDTREKKFFYGLLQIVIHSVGVFCLQIFADYFGLTRILADCFGLRFMVYTIMTTCFPLRNAWRWQSNCPVNPQNLLSLWLHLIEIIATI